MNKLESILFNIRKCEVCKSDLTHGVNPMVQGNAKSKIAIIGQAPGLRVHLTSKPWDDKSGERLRAWLQVDEQFFYDSSKVALIPMGFCYPGKGKTGDLPPRKECAPLWHGPLFNELDELKLILLVGSYAQSYYLKDKKTLTERVMTFENYGPKYFPLPHPSPRNNIWIKKNSWFNELVLPQLRSRIKKEMD